MEVYECVCKTKFQNTHFSIRSIYLKINTCKFKRTLLKSYVILR